MPESLYRQQKACKPRVEDVLPDVLGEDAGKALAFVDALRDAKIRLSWTLTNQWKAVYKGRNLCRITLSSAVLGAIPPLGRDRVSGTPCRLRADGLRGGAGGIPVEACFLLRPQAGRCRPAA